MGDDDGYYTMKEKILDVVHAVRKFSETKRDGHMHKKEIFPLALH